MAGGARVRIDRTAAIKLGMDCADEAALRAAQMTQLRVRNNIRASGRVRTGALVKSIKIWPTTKAKMGASYSVGSSLHYAMFQEKGVGPFGPVKAKFLRFIPKGGTTFVFAKRVKGFPGAHFFEKALQQLNLRDFLP